MFSKRFSCQPLYIEPQCLQSLATGPDYCQVSCRVVGRMGGVGDGDEKSFSKATLKNRLSDRNRCNYSFNPILFMSISQDFLRIPTMLLPGDMPSLFITDPRRFCQTTASY